MLDGDVEHSLLIGDHGGVDVPSRVVVEDDRRVTVSHVGDVQAHDATTGVGEVDPLVVGNHRGFYGDIPPRVGQQLVVVPGDLYQFHRVHGHVALPVVAPIELDGEEPAVLSTFIHDVVDDGRIRVPVVVPDAIDLSGVHRPQKGWITTVEGENPELVVAGAKVEQGGCVRGEGHRDL